SSSTELVQECLQQGQSMGWSSPWSCMGAYNVYKNGKTLYGLATGRKLREMANMKTIQQQVDDSPVVADGAARQLRGANYVE
ncbi:unnamed protein product, partial [Aphanomyces euteiches]